MNGLGWRPLAALGLLCLAGAGLYLVLSSSDSSTDTAAAGQGGTGLAGAQLIARAVDRKDPFVNGRVFVVKAGRTRQLGGPALDCERVDFAGGRGLCLAVAEGGQEGKTTIFGSSLRPLAEASLAGQPLQARVSNDGRYGALTIVGNANVEPDDEEGGVATETTIVDMRDGEEVADLDSFKLRRGGHEFEPTEPGFSGVTFANDSNRLYATLRTGAHSYLVEGNLNRRTMRVLRDGIESPSLSPDGRRLACKVRLGEERWRLGVLSLDTMRVQPLAEHHQIEEQVEWLNDDTLIYSDGFDVYTVPVDGHGEPRLVIHDAVSPSALRISESP